MSRNGSSAQERSKEDEEEGIPSRPSLMSRRLHTAATVCHRATATP